MDCIRVTGIRCYGYTGALPEEQVLGQWFEVDLTFWMDLSVAGHSDRLGDTLDYCDAIATVKEIIKTQKFALVEKLATAIADALLELKPKTSDGRTIQQVRVQLSKLAAPIPDFDGNIMIDITRPITPREFVS